MIINLRFKGTTAALAGNPFGKEIFNAQVLPNISDPEEEIEVVLVVHRGNPHGVARAELLDVGAAEYRAGEIPVRGIGVDSDSARCLDDPEPNIFRLGCKRRRSKERNEIRNNEYLFCIFMHNVVIVPKVASERNQYQSVSASLIAHKTKMANHNLVSACGLTMASTAKKPDGEAGA